MIDPYAHDEARIERERGLLDDEQPMSADDLVFLAADCGQHIFTPSDPDCFGSELLVFGARRSSKTEAMRRVLASLRENDVKPLIALLPPSLYDDAEAAGIDMSSYGRIGAIGL